MNGFTNAILSLLLGWLRSLFNSVWTMLGSDEGGSFFTLLRDHWKVIFLVLCVGGFIVDRIIYLFRWRPYSVWRAKRRRKRARRRSRDAYTQQEYDDGYASGQPDTGYPEYDPQYEPETPYEPPADETTRYRGSAPAAEFAPAYRYDAYESAAEPTQIVSPPAYTRQAEAPTSIYRPPYEPNAGFAPTVAFSSYRAPEEAEPSQNFDGDLSPWRSPQGGFQDFAPRYTPEARPPVQTAEPETDTERYLRDVRSGFAPPPQPEELYNGRNPSDADEPIHPGLDVASFRQSLGLNSQYDAPPNANEAYDRFAPFASKRGDTSPERPRVLGSLAKRARSFVSGEDESNPPTIRDLQSTVDVSTAFHAPVYPRKHNESEEE